MSLGTARWTASKPFYDQQTLAEHGDPAEQYAAKELRIDAIFPHYGQFWRYHVCPATERPASMGFRAGVADIVSVVTQRNYTVFRYLVEALQHGRLVDTGEFGLGNRNCYIALMYAGNALQVFTEFQIALCGKPKPLSGMQDLAAQLGATVDPFPDWNTILSADRERLSIYRNYLTHQGWFYAVYVSASKQSVVLKPEAFTPGAVYTWTHAEHDYATTPSNWMPLQDLCSLIVNDTVAFLDLAYERICATLAPLLPMPAYQALWGWQPNQPVPTLATTPVAPSTASGYVATLPISMTGQTASGFDYGPGGSGNPIV